MPRSASRIAREGPMPVADFMALCLYDPAHGYYTPPRPNRRRRRFRHRAGNQPDVRRTDRPMGRDGVASDRRPHSGAADRARPRPGHHDGSTRCARCARRRNSARPHGSISSRPVRRCSCASARRLGDVEDMTLRWHAALDEVPQGPPSSSPMSFSMRCRCARRSGVRPAGMNGRRRQCRRRARTSR